VSGAFATIHWRILAGSWLKRNANDVPGFFSAVSLVLFHAVHEVRVSRSVECDLWDWMYAGATPDVLEVKATQLTADVSSFRLNTGGVN
jgi:hypothetical protein